MCNHLANINAKPVKLVGCVSKRQDIMYLYREITIICIPEREIKSTCRSNHDISIIFNNYISCQTNKNTSVAFTWTLYVNHLVKRWKIPLISTLCESFVHEETSVCCRTETFTDAKCSTNTLHFLVYYPHEPVSNY